MKPEPKFKVGQAVMIRGIGDTSFDSDFSIITYCQYDVKHGHTEWSYGVHNRDPSSEIYTDRFWEVCLRPIPPEEHTGECAKDYIKNLCGVHV